jgi:predicted transposase
MLISQLSRQPKTITETDTSQQLMALVREFKTIYTSSATKLFDGSSESVKLLKDLMADGRLLDAKPSSKLDLENQS